MLKLSIERLVYWSALDIHKYLFCNDNRKIDYGNWHNEESKEYAHVRSISPMRRMGNVFTFDEIQLWFVLDEVRYCDMTTYLIHHYRQRGTWNLWTQKTEVAHLFALQIALAKQEGVVVSAQMEETRYKYKLTEPLSHRLYAFDNVYELIFQDIDIINFYLYKASLVDNFWTAKKFDTKYRMGKANLYRQSLVRSVETSDIPHYWEMPSTVETLST